MPKSLSKELPSVGSTSTDEEELPEESSASEASAESSESPFDRPSALPLDVVFDMLKNERRRLVLDYIWERDGPFSLSELAEHIAAIENDKPVSALSSSERKRVYVGLYQCHLPRMDDADVIDFDGDRGTIELGPNASQLDRYLDVETEDDGEYRWPRYYLALSAVGGAGLALSQFAAPAQGWLITLVAGGFIAAVGAFAAIHYYAE